MPVTVVEHDKWPSTGRTGVLENITIDQVTAVLGFEPRDFTPYDNAVDHEWRFLGDGVECCVFDVARYDGNGLATQPTIWNTWGPDYVYTELFGSNYTPLRHWDYGTNQESDTFWERLHNPPPLIDPKGKSDEPWDQDPNWQPEGDPNNG